jgi:hypothetical protein
LHFKTLEMNKIDEIGNYLATELGKQKIVQAILHIVLIAYIARVAPTPPDNVLKIFDNIYFKLLFLTLILWSAKHSASTALLASLVFLMVTNYTTTGKLWELMENVSVKKEEAVSTPETAIKVLANAALSPEKSDIESVSKVADIALGAVSTTESSQAVTALAQQAIVKEAGDTEKVTKAVVTALNGLAQPKQDPITGCYPPKSFINMNKVQGASEFQNTFAEF